MQYVNRAIDVPRDAVAVEYQADGRYKVFEVGDTPPAWSQYDATQAATTAAKQAQDGTDAASARAYGKLQSLMAMTPDQVRSWVSANVTNLSQAQDAIATLAVAVGVLARRL